MCSNEAFIAVVAHHPYTPTFFVVVPHATVQCLSGSLVFIPALDQGYQGVGMSSGKQLNARRFGRVYLLRRCLAPLTKFTILSRWSFRQQRPPLQLGLQYD